jgi:hypothetical protein
MRQEKNKYFSTPRRFGAPAKMPAPPNAGSVTPAHRAFEMNGFCRCGFGVQGGGAVCYVILVSYIAHSACPQKNKSRAIFLTYQNKKMATVFYFF